MHDPRVIVAATGGVAALAAGAIGVAIEFAHVRGGCGLGRRRRGDRGGRARRAGPPERGPARAGRGRDPRGATRARVDQRGAPRGSESESGRRGARFQPGRDARSGASRRSTPPTGLYDEKYFAVLAQQQVAAARRSLRPISVIIFEIDAMGEADRDTRLQALGVVGDVVRRTLRESDAACRLGDLMVGAILEDTPEAGAVWAAERVRGHVARVAGRRRADAVGRSRVLPDARVGRGRARAPGEPGARRSAGAGRDRVELAPEPSN